MKTEYNSITRQNRCRQELLKLNLSRVMKKEKLETLQALEFIRDKITNIAEQGPQAYRLEAHRCEYLQNAVLGCPWATNSLATAEKEQWTFQNLYSALDSAWLLHEETEEARHADDGDSKPVTLPKGIFYESQATYGRPRKQGSKSSAPDKRRPTGFKRDYRTQRSIQFKHGCFNCGEEGHYNKGKSPKRVMNTVASALNTRPMHQVLYELSA